MTRSIAQVALVLRWRADAGRDASRSNRFDVSYPI